MDDIVTFIDGLNTYSHPSILRSYKKLLKYLKDNSIILTLNDALTIFSKSYNIRVIIEIINNYYSDFTSNIDSSIENLFKAYEIIKRNNKYDTIPYIKESGDIDLLGLYISKLPGPLSDIEINDALNKIESDDKYSSIIFNHYLRLVVYMAKSYVRDGISIYDLIQEGNIALLSAIQKYNSSYHTDFNSYVSIYIKGSMLDYIHKNIRTIRIPRNYSVACDRMNKTNSKVSIPLDIVIELSKLPLECDSLEQLLEDKEVLKRIEKSSREESLEDKTIRKILLEDACKMLFGNPKLKQKDKAVILLRYGFVDGIDWQYKDIAKLYKMTLENIRIKDIRYKKIFSQDLEALELYKEAEDVLNESIGLIMKYGISTKK